MDAEGSTRASAERELDAVAAAAMPATIEEDVAGWRCRSSPDLPFRRCSSVVPPIDASADRSRFDASLDAVRRWSAARGQRLLVVVPSWLEDSVRVDAWLAERGLEVEAPVEVLTRALDHDELERAEVPGVEVRASGIHAERGHAPDRVQGYRRLLAVHGERASEFEVRVEDATVGRAFGVIDRGWVGVFGMQVEPSWRRRGLARALLAGLLGAAADGGATSAYLQVEADNAAAVALYRSQGFTPHHRYRYRAAP